LKTISIFVEDLTFFNVGKINTHKKLFENIVAAGVYRNFPWKFNLQLFRKFILCKQVLAISIILNFYKLNKIYRTYHKLCIQFYENKYINNSKLRLGFNAQDNPGEIFRIE